MKRDYAALGALTVAAFLTGCTQPSQGDAPTGVPELAQIDVSEYAEVTATVDASRGQISYPIDAYLMTDQDDVLIRQAQEYQIADCVAGKGASYPVAEITYIGSTTSDRRYGLWDVEEAALYGYSFATPPGDGADQSPDMSEAAEAAFNACFDSIEFLPVVTRGSFAGDGQDASLFWHLRS